MIKINSELPNCMLKYNNELNQYDFVLFHLYSTNKKYKNYYLKQRKENPDRLMIFDNSAYEFYVKGETLNMVEYYEAICELQPDFYILPDVLMNKEKTIQGVKEFLDLYSLGIFMNTKVTPKPLAVAQGMSPEDLLDCLKLYKELNITHIALPFHNRFFFEIGRKVSADIQAAFVRWHGGCLVSEDMVYAMGRVQFVRDNANALKDFEYVHLLGSHDPFEKTLHDPNLIDSIDTGYPVKCALSGWELGHEPHKPEIIIDEFLDSKLASKYIDFIKWNVSTFRDL